jgi:hypothetical protein
MPDLWEIRPQVADIISSLRILTSVLGWASLTRSRQVPLTSEFLRSFFGVTRMYVWCYALSGAASFLKCDRSHWGISSDWPLLPRLPCARLLCYPCLSRRMRSIWWTVRRIGDDRCCTLLFRLYLRVGRHCTSQSCRYIHVCITTFPAEITW